MTPTIACDARTTQTKHTIGILFQFGILFRRRCVFVVRNIIHDPSLASKFSEEIEGWRQQEGGATSRQN